MEKNDAPRIEVEQKRSYLFVSIEKDDAKIFERLAPSFESVVSLLQMLKSGELLVVERKDMTADEARAFL